MSKLIIILIICTFFFNVNAINNKDKPPKLQRSHSFSSLQTIKHNQLLSNNKQEKRAQEAPAVLTRQKYNPLPIKQSFFELFHAEYRGTTVKSVGERKITFEFIDKTGKKTTKEGRVRKWTEDEKKSKQYSPVQTKSNSVGILYKDNNNHLWFCAIKFSDVSTIAATARPLLKVTLTGADAFTAHCIPHKTVMMDHFPEFKVKKFDIRFIVQSDDEHYFFHDSGNKAGAFRRGQAYEELTQDERNAGIRQKPHESEYQDFAYNAYVSVDIFLDENGEKILPTDPKCVTAMHVNALVAGRSLDLSAHSKFTQFTDNFHMTQRALNSFGQINNKCKGTDGKPGVYKDSNNKSYYLYGPVDGDGKVVAATAKKVYCPMFRVMRATEPFTRRPSSQRCRPNMIFKEDHEHYYYEPQKLLKLTNLDGFVVNNVPLSDRTSAEKKFTDGIYSTAESIKNKFISAVNNVQPKLKSKDTAGSNTRGSRKRKQKKEE